MSNSVYNKAFYYGSRSAISGALRFAAFTMFMAFVWMIFYSDTTTIGTTDLFWVFYLHMSATVMALAAYALVSLASLQTLIRPMSFFAPAIASAVAPTGLFLTIFAIGTGALFCRPTVGSFWVWDIRLTGLLILGAFFAAFLTLSSQRGLHSRRKHDVSAALVAVAGVAVIPVAYWFFDMFSPFHNDLNSVLLIAKGRDPFVLIGTFGLSILGYCVAVILGRLRTIILERDHRSAWAQDDAIEGDL